LLSALVFGRRCRGVVVRGYAVNGTPNTDHEFQKAESEDEPPTLHQSVLREFSVLILAEITFIALIAAPVRSA
jgi:hypothetical protein